MSKWWLFLLVAVVGVVFAGYKVLWAQTKGEDLALKENPKILIAYYSYSGNTKKVAEAIKQNIGGDLFEIKTEGEYPQDYSAMVQQAKKEIAAVYRPKLLNKVDDMAQYDVVFIGSPNWWGTITPQVSSFVETYDMAGKVVVPFVTHGGGGKQNTVDDLKAQCKGCKVSDSVWVGYGSVTMGIENWLTDLGLK